MTDPLRLIINTQSRRGRAQLSTAVHALKVNGVEVDLLAATSPAESDAALRAAVERGAASVIVGGGDGTLSHAAQVLAHTGTALGVLPLGTGNTFARSVGVPLDLAGAARVIAAGHRTRIDVGRVNGRAFLNSAAMGVSAHIAQALTPELKRRMGLLAWPLVGFQVLRSHQALQLELQLPQEQRRVRTHQLLVANGRYVAGPLVAAPDASVQDHRLDVLALGGNRLRSLLRAGLGWATLGSDRSQSTLRLETQRLCVINQNGPTAVSVDGEIIEAARLDLSVEPRALWVLVPPGFDPQTV
ncbi:diacylglycerol/lipid kinase family protein [Deinococcus sonorensis]|uniref:YegS/Rv2252/BmrU family lipid kinase n=2 Tax=Deinococcus sonorensis TaxID=309891 RepID=A0AAU7UHW5_9DEIO